VDCIVNCHLTTQNRYHWVRSESNIHPINPSP